METVFTALSAGDARDPSRQQSGSSSTNEGVRRVMTLQTRICLDQSALLIS